MANILKKIYFDERHPAGFGSIDKLYEYVKHKGISKKTIRDFLSGQDSYTLFKNRRVNYPTSKTYSSSTNFIWQADLSDVSHLNTSNDGIKFILFCIDIFSRFLWIRVLKNKSSKEVSDAFLSIFNNGNIPAYICSDSGKEFYGDTKQLFDLMVTFHPFI